jgi:hypothetical protein
VNRLPCAKGRVRRCIGTGELAQQMGWRRQFLDFADAQIVGVGLDHEVSPILSCIDETENKKQTKGKGRQKKEGKKKPPVNLAVLDSSATFVRYSLPATWLVKK